MIKIKKNFLITIDGPSGAGKSTISRKIAAALDFAYIDTGAMYRCVGWAALQTGLDLNDGKALQPLLDRIQIRFRAKDGENLVFCNGHEVTAAIRTPAIDQAASAVSRHPEVRCALLPLQRATASQQSSIIDGRDAGTVIFPAADLKIYLDADLATRAQRRYLEQKEKNNIDLQRVTTAIAGRDLADSSRTEAPLQKAPDAVLIDTTQLHIEEVCQIIISLYRERFYERKI